MNTPPSPAPPDPAGATLVRALAGLAGIPLDEARCGTVYEILAAQIGMGAGFSAEALRGVEPASSFDVEWH
jgi:hypothetical protein